MSGRASGGRLAGAAVWLAGLVAAAGVLEWAGRGGLAAPPLTDPAGWADWLQAREPIVAAFGLLRLVALGGLWYLALATAVGALLRLAGAAPLVRVADRLTIGPVRRLLAGTVSLGLAASGVVAVAAPAFRSPLAAATQAAQPTTTATSTTAVPPARVTMHRLGPAETGPPPASASSPEVTSAAAGTWTVKPGDCFWSIADSVLTGRWGRHPDDAEILPYWRRLIDANRHHLDRPDNPDLIFPGQVFTVPAP